MREIIARIVDGIEFEEYRAEYGQTVLCGFARIWRLGGGDCGESEEARDGGSAGERGKSELSLAA